MLCVKYSAKDLMYPGRECRSDLQVVTACLRDEANRVGLLGSEGSLRCVFGKSHLVGVAMAWVRVACGRVCWGGPSPSL
jgi:hypothetical protein